MRQCMIRTYFFFVICFMFMGLSVANLIAMDSGRNHREYTHDEYSNLENEYLAAYSAHPSSQSPYCPNCAEKVVRNRGFNKMRCPYCKHQFCALCGIDRSVLSCSCPLSFGVLQETTQREMFQRGARALALRATNAQQQNVAIVTTAAVALAGTLAYAGYKYIRKKMRAKKIDQSKK
ncbi:IBR domain-containing protein [Candidatus Dependentiae bacterium]|nr:IBR domain-containing protein [Candidatus Dependentiae bacterium]